MSGAPPEPRTAAAETFEAHRPLLFGIAYRMTGCAGDAEDLVQECYLRWSRADPSTVDSPRAFLSSVMTRLAIDHLRSARVRREQYVGPWLPEPVVEAATPEEQMELYETLSMSLLLVLETLGPVERAVFLLREAFGYEFAEIAGIVGKTEANCRQLASRARRRVAEQRPRFEATREEHERLLHRFLEAVQGDDLEALVGMLAEDAVFTSDGGGRVTAARNPVAGAEAIARLVLGLARKRESSGLRAVPAEVNGRPGLVILADGRPQSTWAFEAAGGRVRRIYVVLNPEKLRHVAGSA